MARLFGPAVLVMAGQAWAEPSLRVQVTQRGDFVLIGNTLTQDCGAGVPAPVVGSVGTCGTNTSDTAPDVYWQADASAAGQATASTMVMPTAARTTANLSLPLGATVTHAYLYWAARSPTGVADLEVTLDDPLGDFTHNITAIDSVIGDPLSNISGYYQSVADITAYVQQYRTGPYRVSGVDSVALNNVNNNSVFAGWWMVVVYELQSEPPRNITLFDGFDEVSSEKLDGIAATISGFAVPLAAYNAKLGVVAYEGDDQQGGDSLSWNALPLSNALNPANNFFNGTRSLLGSAVSKVGDLPQLTGGARSMSGIDLDILDITSIVTPGSTSAELVAKTASDGYILGGFITAISTLKPNFTSSAKSVADLNGGVVNPGDELEYTIVVTNTGDDTSKETVLSDKLPAEVTYVPGSLEVVTGPNMGAKTDATADDQGEFDAATSTVVVRLGTGADAAVGGSLNVGGTTTIRFRVTVKPGAGSSIVNQALINASGAQGAPAEDTPTDGNGSDPGAPPTVIIVDSDGDGLSNDDEIAAGTDSSDADTDDDGVLDGLEPSLGVDTDGDGLINVVDADSDNDGLFDGTELGLDCNNPATNPAAASCMPDADMGATKTNPIDVDTDNGGVADGVEDFDKDGKVDPGERDPNEPFDDADFVDSDGDGVFDPVEVHFGSDPNDLDSDEDGALDGQEPDPGTDTDGDGKKNILDPDSDDDGLFDGTEMGKDCANVATDPAAGTCIPDGDMGATTTSPLDADTDDGGVDDGSEDVNGNGTVDNGETDPNAPGDDVVIAECTSDIECGDFKSGRVCKAGQCVDGCRGTGNGCPAGKLCTSGDDTIGVCVANPADPDADQVLVPYDNCPEMPNTDQNDLDGDGVGDVCDSDTPPVDMPSNDADGDGAPDAEDNCPHAANSDQLDKDEDRIGDACDADRDEDGIPNQVDPCPLDARLSCPNPAGEVAGCACRATGTNEPFAAGVLSAMVVTALLGARRRGTRGPGTQKQKRSGSHCC
ncbi:thrombospondin type 3 repeat-containing protein [Polyangium jinanense]|uniref:thrombospondin type 3 repeat-containing protein n=1 Tax=Polyangium jinanense TaxID=2829994 RepID=UPI0023427FFC|nr:thrombospondin type 3 repeat-containing protein [Polyangium jinanense]